MSQKFPDWAPEILVEDYFERERMLREDSLLYEKDSDPRLWVIEVRSGQLEQLDFLKRLLTSPDMERTWYTLKTYAKEKYKPSKIIKDLNPSNDDEDLFCLVIVTYCIDYNMVLNPDAWEMETVTETKDRLEKVVDHLRKAAKLLHFAPYHYPFNNILSAFDIKLLRRIVEKTSPDWYTEFEEHNFLEPNEQISLAKRFYDDLYKNYRLHLDSPIEYSLETLAGNIEDFDVKASKTVKKPHSDNSNEIFFIRRLGKIFYTYLGKFCYGSIASIANAKFQSAGGGWDKKSVQNLF